MAVTPKAFVSHASKDKSRFVIEFARVLRSLGIDAWIDKWEMAAGDSLVDRIFDEGLKEAHVFIIILSVHSISNEWVREELNAGFVKRLDGKCKIIPILLDECAIPECLKSTLYERVKPGATVEETARRIANIIHGINDKPPLGPPPAHVTTVANLFPSLTRLDNLVFSAACEQTMSTGWPMVHFPPLLEMLKTQGLTEDEVTESVRVLEERRKVRIYWGMGGFASFDIQLQAFEEYLKTTEPSYPAIVEEICLQFLNDINDNNEKIRLATSHKSRIVNHVLSYLADCNLIEVFEAAGGGITVCDVSPQLRRRFRNRA